MRSLLFLLLIVFTALTSSAHAGLVFEGQTVIRVDAVQDIVLTPGSPFNDGSDDIFLSDVSITGDLVFERLEQTDPSSIIFDNGTFLGSGFDARLGGAMTLTGGVDPFTPMFAVLDDVVQDPNHPGFASGDPDSIISGVFAFTVPDYGVRLEGLDVDLEVIDPFTFFSDFDGLPPSPGTVFESEFLTGPDSQLEVFIAGTNQSIGYSTNRRLFVVSAVPEPSALGVLGFGAVALYRRRYRRRG